eukprot:13867004-Alexandrium_andersonii.AAC.1
MLIAVDLQLFQPHPPQVHFSSSLSESECRMVQHAPNESLSCKQLAAWGSRDGAAGALLSSNTRATCP